MADLKVKKDGIGVEKSPRKAGDIHEYLKQERQRSIKMPTTKIKENIEVMQERFPERRAAHSVVRFENGMPVPLEEIILSMKKLEMDTIETDLFVFTLKW